jgi:hypothetical protein
MERSFEIVAGSVAGLTMKERMAAKEGASPIAERRRKPRIYKNFRARVYGKNVDGVEFEVGTVLENLSSIGLYLRMATQVEKGATLRIVIRLSTSLDEEESVANIEVRGLVVRTDPPNDRGYGLAVAITDHKFIN